MDAQHYQNLYQSPMSPLHPALLPKPHQSCLQLSYHSVEADNWCGWRIVALPGAMHIVSMLVVTH